MYFSKYASTAFIHSKTRGSSRFVVERGKLGKGGGDGGDEGAKRENVGGKGGRRGRLGEAGKPVDGGGGGAEERAVGEEGDGAGERAFEVQDGDAEGGGIGGRGAGGNGLNGVAGEGCGEGGPEDVGNGVGERGGPAVAFKGEKDVGVVGGDDGDLGPVEVVGDFDGEEVERGGFGGGLGENLGNRERREGVERGAGGWRAEASGEEGDGGREDEEDVLFHGRAFRGSVAVFATEEGVGVLFKGV